VIGLNFDYVYLNIVGHSVYGAFNVGLFWVKTIQVKNAASTEYEFFSFTSSREKLFEK
jgi:hypothetical protein